MNHLVRSSIAFIEDSIKDRGRAIYCTPPTIYGKPSTAYSVGLERVGLPEIFSFGLRPDDAENIIGTVADIAMRSGSPTLLTHGLVMGGVFDDRPIGVLEMDSRQVSRYLTFANMLAVKDVLPVPAVQLVIPDSELRWPWQKGHSHPAFPLLGKVPASLS